MLLLEVVHLLLQLSSRTVEDKAGQRTGAYQEFGNNSGVRNIYFDLSKVFEIIPQILMNSAKTVARQEDDG